MLGLSKGGASLQKIINIVDDHLDQYRDVIRYLTKRGYRINEFESPDDVNSIEEGSLWIVDKRFGEQNRPLGDVLVNRLLRVRNVRVVMLTAFHFVEKIGEIIYNEALRTFYVSMVKLGEGLIKFEAISKFLDKFFSEDSLPRKMSLDQFHRIREIHDFRQLSEDEQEEVTKKVSNAHIDEITDLWNGGAIWVGIFGQGREEIRAVYRDSELLSDEEIRNLEENFGLPCFEFGNSLAFNNAFCSGASVGGSNVWNYPAMFFDGESIEESKVDRFGIHFDTGADVTLLFKEFVNSIKSKRISVKGRVERLQSIPHYVREFRATLLFCFSNPGNPEDLNTMLITLNGLSVSDWIKSAFYMECGLNCTRGVRGHFCKLRENGLLGRNIITDNSIGVILEPDSIEVKGFSVQSNGIENDNKH